MVRQGGQEVLRQLPPGFRFRPTDEELVVQYLRRKALGLPLPAAVISDVHNLHSLDPWDISGMLTTRTAQTRPPPPTTLLTIRRVLLHTEYIYTESCRLTPIVSRRERG